MEAEMNAYGLMRGIDPIWEWGAEAVTAYGGRYDYDELPDGFLTAFKNSWSREAFGGADHDLVVPLDSALAVGEGHTISGSCDPFQYFEDTGI